jgi:hypothetical protein
MAMAERRPIMAGNKKRWSDLNAGQKAGTVMLGMVQFTLLGLALADIRRRPESEINGSKALWTALSFVNFIGPLSYFLFGRKRGGVPGAA